MNLEKETKFDSTMQTMEEDAWAREDYSETSRLTEQRTTREEVTETSRLIDQGKTTAGNGEEQQTNLHDLSGRQAEAHCNNHTSQTAVDKEEKTEEKNGNTDVTCHDEGRPEGGWGWVVCAASMWVFSTITALFMSFSILYYAMLDEYSKGDPSISFKTSWVGSLQNGLTYIMSLLTGVLCNNLGFRKVAFPGAMLTFVGIVSSSFVTDLVLLYLTFGILMGLGFGLTFSPSLVILGHYFKRRLGLANGIVTCGTGVLAITYSLGLPRLLHAVGLKFTLLCIGGALFLQLPCVLTWKPVLHRQKTEPPGSSPEVAQCAKPEVRVSSCAARCHWLQQLLAVYVRIWRNKQYALWVGLVVFAFLSSFIPLVHIVKHSEDRFPDSDSSLLPLLISATSCISRLLSGFLSDRPCINRVHLQASAFLLTGISVSCIPLADTFTSLAFDVAVIGLCDGAVFCLIGPIVFDLVRSRDAPQAMGCFFALQSLPVLFGPPAAGFLYDRLGSYTVAFHLAGIPAMVAGCVLILAFSRQTKRRFQDCCLYKQEE